MKQIIRLIKYAKEWRKYLIISTLSLLGITGIALVSPSIIRNILAIIEGNFTASDMPTIFWLSLLMLLLYALRGVFQFLSNYYGHVTSWNLVSKIRVMLYDHFQKLSMSYYGDKQTGQLMSNVVNDTATFENLIAHSLPDLISNVILFVGVTIILFTVNPILALLTCIPIPFIFLLSKILRKMRRNFKKAQQKVANLNAVLQDNFSGMKEIQVFNKQDYERNRVKEQSDDYSKSIIKALYYSGIFHPIIAFLSSIGTVVVMGFGGYLALKGLIKISDIVAFLLYLSMFYGPVTALARVLEDVQMALSGAERVFAVLDTEPTIKDSENAKEVDYLDGQISFEDLSFSYDDTTKVLNHISFSVSPGEMVALVGATGVGKSTISALISRFYEPTGGRITMDGIDIRDITLHCLRNEISLVLQDVFLFNGTIYENIAYGKDNATREEVINAAKIACIDDFITNLPQGYDTMVGERGMRLSGGQKQRLSIARCILKNSSIMILDEATSAVDTETEKEIQLAIDKIVGTRTLIVIAHRLSTIRKADKILVLDKGEIVESGTHDKLIAKHGVYYNLCNIQNNG
ncbi:MAG: ABC transporter ATP-binding protein [Clostridia bacterium]